jgi:ferritin-like metal-binding protein YciE
VFEKLGKEPKGVDCPAIDGIIDEAALPKMVKAAHSEQLQRLFDAHLAETEAQAERLNECLPYGSRCWAEIWPRISGADGYSSTWCRSLPRTVAC